MSIALSNLDFSTVQGNSILLKFEVVDIDCLPFNLNGCTIFFSAKPLLGGSNVLYKNMPSPDIAITNAVAGLFEVFISSAETSSLVGDFEYDVILDKASSRISVRKKDSTPGIITFQPRIIN